MSDSQEEGFHQANHETFIIKIKNTQNLKLLRNRSISTFLYRRPISLHHQLQLYEYSKGINNFCFPAVESFTAPSDQQPLMLVRDKGEPAILLSDLFPRKFLCVYNRFHENLMIKRDLTIIIRNINRRIRNDQISNFNQKQSPVMHKNVYFSSDFEGGNLHCVYKDKQSGVYYLLLQNDINTHGYNIWFHFSIKSAIAMKYQFVIVNLARQVKFDQEMSLLTFTVGSQYKRKVGFKCVKSRFKHCQSEQHYFSLHFQYYFQAGQETYFTISPPYTYSKLFTFLRDIQRPLYSHIFIFSDIAGKSELGNFIPYIKICNKDKSNKKTILITARQHPCETVGSFICQQILKILTSQDSLSLALLDEFNFYIVPMINPDGVIHGNSRTNLLGYDINRSWNIEYPYSIAECSNVWANLQKLLNKQGQIAWSFDLHGHSKQLGYFAYFCEENQSSLILNHFLASKSNIFNREKCIYSIGKNKKSSLRVQLYQKLNVQNAVTIQTSYYGFRDDQNQFHHFDISHFHSIASNLLESLLETNNTLANKNVKLSVMQQISQIIRVIHQLDTSNAKDQDSDSNPEQDYLLLEERDQQQIFGQLNRPANIKMRTTQEQYLKKVNNYANLSSKFLNIHSRKESFNQTNKQQSVNSLRRTIKREKEGIYNMTFYSGNKISSPKNILSFNDSLNSKIRRKIYSQIKNGNQKYLINPLKISKQKDQTEEILKRSIDLKKMNKHIMGQNLKNQQSRYLARGQRTITERCELQSIVYPTAANVGLDLRSSLRCKKECKNKQYGCSQLLKKIGRFSKINALK